MKNKNLVSKAGMLLLLLCCIMSSCNNDDELNSKELKVYISTGFPNNQLPGSITQTPVGDKGDMILQIPVQATRPVVAQTQVSLTVDASLIESYNATNSTNYKLLPAESYKMNTTTTIDEGQQRATEPIKVEITNSRLLDPTTVYILPVKVTNLSSTDKGISISSNFSTVYVVYKVGFNNVDPDATSPDGTELDRTTMQINDENSDVTESLKDNDFNTFWFSPGNPVLTIDMKENVSIKGFKCAPMYIADYMYYGDLGTISSIESSLDGVTWQPQGSAKLPYVGGAASEPQFQAVKFYGSVSCRYLRLTVTSTNMYYIGMSEFYLIN